MNQNDFRAALQGRVFRLPGWATPFVVAGALGLGVLLFLVAASLALIIVPLVLAGGTFAAWRIRRQIRRAGAMPGDPFDARPRDGKATDVIDVEYRIIERKDTR